jgi:soluble calcium-activated nucleotidase 1
MYNMGSKDWRKALRSGTPAYRIGNSTIRFQIHLAWILACCTTLFFIFFYIKPASRSSYAYNSWGDNQRNGLPQTTILGHRGGGYNSTYPLSATIVSSGITTFRIGVIADLDTNSKGAKDSNVWRSFYKKGHLSYNAGKRTVAVTWDKNDPIQLTSSYSLKGRGMELSELVVFNGKLLSFDDRTGFIYEITNDNQAIPWILLTDGDGKSTSKGETIGTRGF